jgi:hypothetical protein
MPYELSFIEGVNYGTHISILKPKVSHGNTSEHILQHTHIHKIQNSEVPMNKLLHNDPLNG